VKIGRFSDGKREFWAVINLDESIARPLAGSVADWAPPLTADFGSEPAWDGPVRDLAPLRPLAPVERHSKVVAAGATYAKHVAGLGLKMPEKPAAFLKPYDSVIGPDDEIAYPTLTRQLDYEAELVVVLGTPRITDRDNALAAVLGYTAGNDVSARDLQFGGSVTGMDMFSAKGLDRTSGVGPWIVTRDEFGDQSPDLELRLTVDGELRQHDRTGSLVWGIGDILSYVDERSSLHAGDIMFTGTPAGVAHEDGRYLEPGQAVVVTIERIGSLRNVVGPRPATLTS
jgi:2-keto-4-pentenoate hydratase/2-oxohepta-3-ene-1,7-dioic acid hydratase in catechol pathway